jgi:hypothetical protein
MVGLGNPGLKCCVRGCATMTMVRVGLRAVRGNPWQRWAAGVREPVRWGCYAGWLGTLCLFGASFTWAIVGGSHVLPQVAAALAVGASVGFGAAFGYRREWLTLVGAALVGTALLVGWAEVAWWDTTFVLPSPGGSGGFLVILAPVLTAVLAGVAGLAGLAAVLGAGAVAGLALRRRPAAAGLAGLGAMVLVSLLADRFVTGLGGIAVPVMVAARPSSVAGFWEGSRGASLTLSADGTLHARGLPRGFGEASAGTTPVAGAGSWHVGRVDAVDPPGVIFEFSNGSQASLLLERDGSALYLFYDRGDPDEGWTGQYRFTRR